jgi:hypothetical protein
VGKIALRSSSRKRGPMITGRCSWVPALAALGRDDSWMARRINLRMYEITCHCFPLLFTMNFATHTCLSQ